MYKTNFSPLVLTSIFLLLFILWSSCEKSSLCDGVDCGPNGQCVINTSGEAVCNCFAGYEGTNCNTFNPCLLLECQNGGSCIKTSDTTAMCNCAVDTTGQTLYIGESCEKINPCYGFDCGENGNCVVDSLDRATCDCMPGFIGELCDQVDLCFEVACFENSTCQNGVCECNQGYEGDSCTIEIRAKLLGNYSVQNSCLPDMSYTCELVADAEEVSKIFLFSLNNNPNDSIYGLMNSSYTFILPLQMLKDSTNFNGSGIFNVSNNSVELNYITQKDTTSVDCILILD